jgi:two-component system nitrogen regulation sensor histidine kinase NtrY
LKSKLILLVTSLVLFNAAYLFEKAFKPNPDSYVASFENTLHEKEQLLIAEINRLQETVNTKSYNALFIEEMPYLKALSEEKGLYILIYENDSLKFWTDNAVPVENSIKEICLDPGMVKLKNGWYQVIKSVQAENSSKTIVGLILIKNQYPYQNNYLTNSFHADFDLPAGAILSTVATKNSYAIKDVNNMYLFSIQFYGTAYYTSGILYIVMFLNLLGCVLFILLLRQISILIKSKTGDNMSTIIFVTVLFVLRYWSLKFSFPKSIYQFDLFSPSIYADASSIWFSSLGDLLINIILLFSLGYYTFKNIRIEGILSRLFDFQKQIILLCLLLFFFLAWSVVAYIIAGLINNSNISFEVNNILSLNIYSYIALSIIGLLLLMCCFLVEMIRTANRRFNIGNSNLFKVFIYAVFIYAPFSYWLLGTDVISFVFPFVLLFLTQVLMKNSTTYSFAAVILLVVINSFYTEYIISKYSSKKEIAARKVFAEKIADEQDPVAEFLFNDVENKIQSDTLLSGYISGISKQPVEFERRMQEVYFSGFWEKYDVRISFYDSACTPVIKPQNLVYDNNVYFDELIAKKSIPTSNKNLYFINNASSGKISYIAKLALRDSLLKNKRAGTLYLEMDAKLVSNEIGYPVLLLDKRLTPDNEFSNYSYAKYKNHQLVHQFGKYFYNNNDVYFSGNDSEFTTEDKDGYNHLLYRSDKATLIVVSIRNEGIYGKITVFSYLFTFFSLLLLILFFIRQLSVGGLSQSLSFKYRIQLLLVSIILTSLVLFGGGTIYYIQQQFKTQNKENISEKTRSVLLDIENRLNAENEFQKPLADYVSFLLKKSSNIFFTDINLYDVKGDLYASSRSRIFDNGLISKKMNTSAFVQMAVLGKREFVHDESIGASEYLSSYIPFKNKEGKKLGYINLPYFAKQNDLEKEISVYLVALINIYVLLFVLSVVVAIIISNYVTQPLRLIQEKLGNIKLGRFNEPIEWKQNDEIGNLVAEYNRMIFELMQSAELLAKSERESAWREMAKQVAHEIKNPLTPMKLSVQHLQRLHDDGSPDFDEKVKQLSQTIIEQIDMLSNIATAFSSFAKMPKPSLEKINLNEVIMNSISLFNESGNIQLKHKFNIEKACVMADKEQLLRVFNNLIKNAMQSIPSDKQGVIKIELSQNNDFYIVSVRDNGEGIKPENMEKIFVPNFTTKSTGSGLGLAIVKNIIDNFEGKISFENNPKEGTTFFVSLPVA